MDIKCYRWHYSLLLGGCQAGNILIMISDVDKDSQGCKVYLCAIVGC